LATTQASPLTAKAIRNMNDQTSVLFDKTALPSALGTSEADVLIQFYEMFIAMTMDAWSELCGGNTNNDLRQVRQTAHKLKSSSASVGALALANSLKELEMAAADGNVGLVNKKIAITTHLVHSTVEHVRLALNTLQQQPLGES
jgi:HPt (histidine-containing phosphotransfer) domain-containing protein